ncbi:perforin-like protein 5 [Hepatocystis sp. ex Piliocolobus tephrosceles]|nr:perforin-like protein 5 [Hepatocystis sp. ex Piliocolobus tephrosceles]
MKLISYVICVFVLIIHLVVLCHKKKKKNVLNRDLYNEDIGILESKYLTNYLGMSYDIIKGNPLGDPKFMIDIGYKKYILSNELELISDKKKNNNEIVNRTDNSSSNSGSDSSSNSVSGSSSNSSNNSNIPYVTVQGGKLQCSTEEGKLIINDMSDIDKQYKSYKFLFKHDIHPFNASNYYKMLADRINRGDSTIIYEKQCVKYFASLKGFDVNNLNLFFFNMLNELGKNYQNVRSDTFVCNLELFKKNKYDENCLNTITPWINFFSFYGTHLVSGAYFGGKIIQNMFVESDNHKYGTYKKKIDENRLNPFFNNNNFDNTLHFGSMISKEKIRYIVERNYILNGGDNSIKSENKNDLNKSFSKWEKSIKGKLAKPIHLILIPFADFIESEEGKTSYYIALEFYSNLNYSNYNLYPYKQNVNENELYKKHIRNWNQVINKNVNINVSLTCSVGMNIISGFILTNKKTLNNNNNLLHLCTYNDCSSKINLIADNNFEFGWILCSQDNINDYYQISKTVTGNENITCPAKMKVGYGFYITIKEGINTNMIGTRCKSNKKKCQIKVSNKNLKSLVWVNCISNKKKKLLKSLDSKIYSENLHLKKKKKVSLSCKHGSFIIAGFAVDYIPSRNNDYIVCSVGSPTCELDISVSESDTSEFHNPLIFIVCSSL